MELTLLLQPLLVENFSHVQMVVYSRDNMEISSFSCQWNTNVCCPLLSSLLTKTFDNLFEPMLFIEIDSFVYCNFVISR